MDRSFLSRREIVDAVRGFVCVRLATYESASEGTFLKALARTRSGELENTVFAVLEPDGKTKIGRAGRSQNHVFRSRNPDTQVRIAAETLKRIAKKFPGVAPVRALPLMADVRRALNVAACDMLPVVVAVGPIQDWKKALASLVWEGATRGTFLLAHASSHGSLSGVTGANAESRLLVVEPDAFGVKGKVVAQTAATDLATLCKTRDAGLKAFRPEAKDSERHIREGVRRGVRWKSEIPVTDPGGRDRR